MEYVIILLKLLIFYLYIYLVNLMIIYFLHEVNVIFYVLLHNVIFNLIFLLHYYLFILYLFFYLFKLYIINFVMGSIGLINLNIYGLFISIVRNLWINSQEQHHDLGLNFLIIMGIILVIIIYRFRIAFCKLSGSICLVLGVVLISIVSGFILCYHVYLTNISPKISTP